MRKSTLKHRGWERILTLVLAFAMLAAYLPAGIARAAEAETPMGTYVLEAKDLEAFAAGDRKDGEEAKAGTDSVFSIVWSEKSKVDSSSKTWDDGYSSGQRINLGGTASPSKNSIRFTTAAAVTVKIWWAAGDDGRQMGILNSAGEQIAVTEEASVKNDPYLSTLSLEAAGTYYLGGSGGNNYIFKVEIVEAPAAEAYLFEAKDLEAFGEGAKADGDETSAGTDGFFAVIWSAKSKVDSSSKTWDDGYSSEQRINLGGAASVSKNSIRFTTTGAATVKIWWAAGDNDRQIGILDSAGQQAAVTEEASVKNDPYLSTLNLEAAGTYYLGGSGGNNYIFKVEVTTGAAAVERATWSEVAVPEITGAVQEDENILVTVSALIGTDYADKVTVTMTDESGNTESKSSTNPTLTEHEFTFTPSASGTYAFSVAAARDDEAVEHEGAEEKTVEFVLPLTKPVFKSVTNNGGGKVTVEWNGVTEAEKYRVTVKEAEKSVETETLTAVFEDLAIDETYTIEVVALCAGRGDSPAGTVQHTVLDRVERNWVFATFGSSTSTSKNGFAGNANDGEVTVWCEGGAGKLVPNSTDGIAFYYIAIPTTENFSLTANIHVDSWTYSNGQDGFGMMVSDRVGANGAGAGFWNNSYMAVVTKVEYYWNDDLKEVTDSGRKYTMRLGVGAQEKINVVPETVNDSMPEGFQSTLVTLETTAGSLGLDAGDYNLAGGHTGELAYPAAGELITDFKLTIERTPTGYFVSYEDADGNVTTQKYYDPDALSHLDEDYVYAGFFAARNARITVSDIELTTVAVADDDREVEERPITEVTPSYTVESAKIANSKDYDFVYYGNADGTLVVKAADGTVLFNGHVTANTKTHIQTTLALGDNTFTWSMTPDEGYHPDNNEYKILSSYDTVSGEHTVNYAVHSQSVIYVGPNGSAGAKGTKRAPMDIYEAVKKAAPGQTIVLLEGTYHMSGRLVIERGINGTEDAYITLMADPSAATRPVLNFGGGSAGIILAGDYWHLYGFDVTNSANGEKGIQVSGSHNVLERLMTYKNGNTGLQISRYKGSDLHEDWPAYNLVLNCSSYLNSDSGYEDADGFAAKLTIGEGNVFDGCIAAYNADDGWDLYAKVETGSIGKVVIQNSVAFCNGWLWNEDGWWTKDSSALVNAGNGNGFKMGGESLPGGHTLINSVSFGNKAKGFDSNSCPDIKVYNSTSFNNNSYNVAFYTNTASQTGFAAEGIISYKNNGSDTKENFKVMGTQKEDELKSPTNYYYDGSVSANTEGVQVSDDWFVHVDMALAISGGAGGITRNADGTINMNGFLELTAEAPEDAGARLEDAEQEKAPELPEIDVTVIPAATVNGDSATSAVSDSMGEDIVNQAMDKGCSNVVIKPDMPDSIISAEVTIPGETLEKLGENTDADVTVITPAGCVTLPNRALAELGGIGVVTVGVRTVNGVSTVSITAGGESVDKVTGGIKVAVPLMGGQVVVLVDENDEETVIPKSLWKDGVAYAVIDGPAMIRVIDNSKAFDDVSDSDWYSASVDFASSHGLFIGVKDNRFAPSDTMSRAMAATVLWRLECEADAGSAAGFSDVDSGKWYTDAVAWAGANGIIIGMGNDVFRPDQPVTREALAVMLYRYAVCLNLDIAGGGDLSAFTDGAAVSSWAKTAVEWAVGAGLLQGTGANRLQPGAGATRAQVATVILRFVELIVK